MALGHDTLFYCISLRKSCYFYASEAISPQTVFFMLLVRRSEQYAELSYKECEEADWWNYWNFRVTLFGYSRPNRSKFMDDVSSIEGLSINEGLKYD